MGFWDFFRHKKAAEQVVAEDTTMAEKVTSSWQEVPAYIETDPEKYELVSVIAAAIMAGEQKDSQFVVRRILERNPEAKLVSVISASIAAGDQADSQLIVRKIMKK